MEIHTFRAATLQEALMLVRHELGPEASVLRTREVTPRLFGMFGKRGIEVDASRDAHVARRISIPTNSTSESLGATAWPTSEMQETASLEKNTPRDLESTGAFADLATETVGAPIGLERARQDKGKSSDRRPLTPAMFEVFTELLDGEIDPEAARLMLQQVATQLSPDQLEDTWLIKGRLCQAVQHQIEVSGPIQIPRSGAPYKVALVGPTGVGKTTTLAKIAASIHFDQGVHVGFITLDTFRLGAVDQLRQYADLLAAPVEVVSATDQIRPALARLRECGLILIDTAGRSPRDPEQIEVMKEFLDIALPDETHLVLSAASSRSHAQMVFDQFSALRPNRLLISKLDESNSLGGWYPLLASSPWALSYLTTGQHVPEDLLVANRRRVASLIIGQSTQMAWK